MSSNVKIEDDDLAMYAMGLLAPPESSAISRAVAGSDDLRQRLAVVQQILGLYGEASVDLQPAPEGSLDRLKNLLNDSVALISAAAPASPAATASAAKPVSPAVLPAVASINDVAREGGPSRAAEAKAEVRWVRWLGYAGWAVAALLLVTAGKLYHDRSTLNAMVAAQTARTAQISSNAAELNHERDLLQLTLAEQARQIEQMSQRTASARSDTEMLRSAIASQDSQITSQNNRIASQNNQIATKESQIASQSNQVARLSTDAATARELLSALTGSSALRVTLTKPKSHAVPLAQAAYVASRRTLVFLASNLAPLKANKVYQLWLMPANGSPPVPAGTFAPDARGGASLFYTDFPSAVTAAGFSVTIENAGGAQTPTLPIILASGAA